MDDNTLRMLEDLVHTYRVLQTTTEQEKPGSIARMHAMLKTQGHLRPAPEPETAGPAEVK